MSELKILTVQKDPKTIVPVLRKIKDSNMILYSNCITELVIGGRTIPIPFNNMLYSMDDNLAIFFLKNGKINQDQLKELLEKEEISYHEISFIPEKEKYYYTNDCKGLIFPKSKEIVSRGIKNSKLKGIDDCTYYPNINGYFSVNYMNSLGKKECMLKEPIKGVIDLEDKIILMNKSNENDHPTEKEILEVLVEEEQNVLIKKETKLKNLLNHKYYIKKKSIGDNHG